MYIDQAVAAIIDCVKTKKLVSPWIERKLNVSLKRVPACLSVHPAKLSTADNGTESWQIIEKVPAFKHLPAYDQVHSVRFCNGSPSSCSCPYFVSNKWCSRLTEQAVDRRYLVEHGFALTNQLGLHLQVHVTGLFDSGVGWGSNH
jgi:hypothetical protein